MTNLSKELCEICGIEGKWVEYTTETTDGCVNLGKKRVFPDFEQAENFAKLFRLITTLDDFRFTTGNIIVRAIPAHKQVTELFANREYFCFFDPDPIQAFIACVIKGCVRDKDMADYIKETEWVYE